MTGPTSGTFTAGQTVPIQWTAGNVAAGSTVNLCYDTDTALERQRDLDQVRPGRRQRHGTYNWNTTGVAPGTYYIGGYL